ncbi:MAG: M48 family metalloprotease [Bdellovibrionales bacterium]
MFSKSFFLTVPVILGASLLLQGCSTNPATGKQQFTALMSPSQENKIGAQEHEKIIQQFGLYEDKALSDYVTRIGQKVTAKTERPDVTYKFYVLDSPVVNAFALPGGYIYLSRGLIALANNEAQMAAVLAHEAAHITARHSAERYSRTVVTSIGAGVLGAVIGVNGAAQALGAGTNLYLSSYSRHQENEADSLGLRYMTQGGYDPDEMAAFLSALQAQSGLDARLAGRNPNSGVNYFSTHPPTPDRVRKTSGEAEGYEDSNVVNRDAYFAAINGMTYGDSADQGFAKGQIFYHSKIGFKFTAPDGYRIINQPAQVIVKRNNSDDVMVFDMAKRNAEQNASNYITQTWLREKRNVNTENITINGMKAATASIEGNVNNKSVTIRVIAIEFNENTFARFQIAIPKRASSATLENLKRASYSFDRLTQSEKNKLSPNRIHIVTAKSGNTIASMARNLPFSDNREDRFRVLNALLPNEKLVAGRKYKTISNK